MSVAHPHRPGSERDRPDPGSRLVENDAALRAIQRGEIDAVLVAGRHGTQVFTLEGTGHTYRVLVESMNEGALSVTSDGVILYANQRFARMVRTPLAQVQGASLLRFLPEADQPGLLAALGRPSQSGARLQLELRAGDGTQLPVHLSLRDVPLGGGGDGAVTHGIVVTDMSEVRRAEGMLRTFAHFMVRAHDLERERVFGELHDNISQRLCGLLLRWQALADKLPSVDDALRAELAQLTAHLGEAAEQVQLLSDELRSSGLAVMGLIPAVRGAAAEFEERTRIAVSLVCPDDVAQGADGAHVMLYRILQEALDNVERHARARRVEIELVERDGALRLRVGDDGVGFRMEDHAASGFGMIGMSERARSVGGTFELLSEPGAGTTVSVSVPLADEARSAG